MLIQICRYVTIKSSRYSSLCADKKKSKIQFGVEFGAIGGAGSGEGKIWWCDQALYYTAN